MFRVFLRRCERQYPHYRDINFEEMVEWHEPHFTHYRHTEIMDDMLWHVCCFGGINDLVVYSCTELDHSGVLEFTLENFGW